MRIPRLILVLILFHVAPCIEAAAEIVQPGVQYKGEAKLEFPDYGASMVLPAGWVAVLPKDGNDLLMRSEVFEAYIFATIEEMTVEGAQSAMTEAISVGNGIVFHLKGQVKLKDSVLTADYSVSGSRSPLVGQVTAVVGKSGRGVSFMAASGPQDAPKLRAALGRISGSLSLLRPKSESIDSQAKGASPWAEHLSGHKLSRFFTRSGYTEEEYIWLCPEASAVEQVEPFKQRMLGNGRFREVSMQARCFSPTTMAAPRSTTSPTKGQSSFSMANATFVRLSTATKLKLQF